MENQHWNSIDSGKRMSDSGLSDSDSDLERAPTVHVAVQGRTFYHHSSEVFAPVQNEIVITKGFSMYRSSPSP